MHPHILESNISFWGEEIWVIFYILLLEYVTRESIRINTVQEMFWKLFLMQLSGF